MADPKEFNSIDDLFRKTFDGLPESPSPSGWDVPSDKVWEQVKTRIEPPRSGWSTQTLTLISAFAVVLAVAMYLFFVSDTPKEMPVQNTQTKEQPAVVQSESATPAVMPTPETASPKPLEHQGFTKSNQGKETKGAATESKTTAPVNSTSPEQAPEPKKQNDALPEPPAPKQQSNTAEQKHPGGALPLPGSKPVSPNTKERLYNEIWHTPLQPLPFYQGKSKVPAIPELLQYKPNAHKTGF